MMEYTQQFPRRIQDCECYLFKSVFNLELFLQQTFFKIVYLCDTSVLIDLFKVTLSITMQI